MIMRQKCAGRKATCILFELKPAHFFEKRAGPNLHTFGVNCAGFAQKCAEKPAHFFEGQCALRPWNHWVFGVPAHFRAFSLFLYYFKKEKKGNNIIKTLAKKTRDKSVQRPDTCTLLERNNTCHITTRTKKFIFMNSTRSIRLQSGWPSFWKRVSTMS